MQSLSRDLLAYNNVVFIVTIWSYLLPCIIICAVKISRCNRNKQLNLRTRGDPDPDGARRRQRSFHRGSQLFQTVANGNTERAVGNIFTTSSSNYSNRYVNTAQIVLYQ